MPPSIDELKQRLKKRKTEPDDKINIRISKAKIELTKASSFDFVIENNDLKAAKEKAYELVSNFLKSQI